jgi:hypothetical protein
VVAFNAPNPEGIQIRTMRGTLITGLESQCESSPLKKTT